jgi:hypothetical protein
MDRRLLKMAASLDYFLRKDMTPDDQKNLNKILDEHGLPPAHNTGAGHMEAGVPSKMENVLAHLKRHKGKYGLGAAALLGAALLSRRAPQQDMAQMEAPPEQSGF